MFINLGHKLCSLNWVAPQVLLADSFPYNSESLSTHFSIQPLPSDWSEHVK